LNDPRQCDFLLMRYVPDPFKNEFVNIGVLLLGRDDDFAGVRFTRDWARVRCLDPQADVDILDSLESDIRDQLESNPESRKQFIYRLQDTMSTGLQLSPPTAMLSESPQKGPRAACPNLSGKSAPETGIAIGRTAANHRSDAKCVRSGGRVGFVNQEDQSG
jgi:hypothetical protein